MQTSDLEIAQAIAERVFEKGGKTYFVGGYVRDLLNGKEGKDIDVEVHGISPSCLKEILDSLGERMEIGESFGIFGLKGTGLDIALPRKETSCGGGHKDFDIVSDPFIGTTKAAKRRDFTINAIMQDVRSGERIDPFGGMQDLANGVIRHVDSVSFVQDPLRVLRAAQFAARFGFRVADETIALCSQMDLSQLPKERVMAELQKALLKAERPSVFFEILRQMGQLSVWFGELESLIGVPQDPTHHAEGDVWVHTMMVLDEAVKFVPQAANPTGFLLAALTHDFGKAVCTQTVDGKIHAYGHEVCGLPLIERFIKRITTERKLLQYVLNLAQYHMQPNILATRNARIKSTNKMFDASVDPVGLIYLATADAL